MENNKFRVWYNKEFVYFTLFSVPIDAMHGEVTRFTGLKDTNGVDIYEGDIIVKPNQYIWFVPVDDNVNLNNHIDLSEFETIPNYRGEVEFYYSGWQVSVHSVNPKNSNRATGCGLNEDGIDEDKNSEWEVIGNKFENSELLKITN